MKKMNLFVIMIFTLFISFNDCGYLTPEHI